MATITPLKAIPHTRIENSIIDEHLPQIGVYGFTIYSVIKRHLNQKTGECYPSYKTIARKIGIDRSTVIRYVNKLKALNLISPLLRFKEDGSSTSNQYSFDKDSGTEPLPVVAQDNPPSGSAPPEQSETNKKERTMSDGDFFAEKTPPIFHAGLSPFHKSPQEPTQRQRNCPHPPTEIVFLAENVTICYHCYGLLDENLTLKAKETLPGEIVAA